MNTRIFTLPLFALLSIGLASAARRVATLRNDSVTLSWEQQRDGWKLSGISAFGISGTPAAGSNIVLFSAAKPDTTPLSPAEFGCEEDFPGKEYRYVIPSWEEATSAVALNRAGEPLSFHHDKLENKTDSSLTFSYATAKFSVKEIWKLRGTDIHVGITLTANQDGWYSIATPSVMTVADNQLDFAIIPGVLHGNRLSDDFPRAYAYGWGIPSLPVVFRERSTSTLTSILADRNGLTIAVTAEPGTAAEPWGNTTRNSGIWRLGLSAMNRDGELTPTLYHPVLGEDGSYLEKGQSVSFNFLISFGNAGWWGMFNHVANDIYRFGNSLDIRHNRRSLSDRLLGIHAYVVNDSTSKWHTVDYDGTLIGAQEYLGGVYMAKKDAMKNADYGAMWMLGTMTGDSLLTEKRLPYALNFKLKQQNDTQGMMHGASNGQYYLRDSHRFVEEWGPYTEPIATTYYMLMDLGNIALFEPDNNEVKDRLRKAADWLLSVQKPDGSWTVAYADTDYSEAFADLKDYRPTFYGLLIAYRILGDSKYLDGARRGADWLVDNAVIPQQWLGVCGDTRFAPDFATAQAAQALLEFHDITGEPKYLDAAIATARFYTTSVYTNPIASDRELSVKGVNRRQWEITTSGLSYEHGGIIGSTNLHGPILLASHAGMFVRMYDMTKERIFLDMARAAAIGRDAFVDTPTAVASYYWAAMDRGAGPYPHHAWWQMGWITDYLLAELELRSGGEIKFPAGFITPKVGPHRTFAFRPGTIYGETANLVMEHGLANCDNPNVEILTARSDNNLLVMVMNDLNVTQTAEINIKGEQPRSLTIAPYGLETIKIPLTK